MPRGPWRSDICYYCKKLGHWKRKCPQRYFIESLGCAAVHATGPCLHAVYTIYHNGYYPNTVDIHTCNCNAILSSGFNTLNYVV